MDIQAKASSSVRWSLFTVPIATWDGHYYLDYQNAYDAKMLSLAYRLHIYMYIYLFVEFTREHFFITFTMTLQLFIWKGTKTTINGMHAILFIPFKVQGGWNQGGGPLMPYVPGPHSFRCFKLHRFVVEIKMNSELE